MPPGFQSQTAAPTPLRRTCGIVEIRTPLPIAPFRYMSLIALARLSTCLWRSNSVDAATILFPEEARVLKSPPHPHARLRAVNSLHYIIYAWDVSSRRLMLLLQTDVACHALRTWYAMQIARQPDRHPHPFDTFGIHFFNGLLTPLVAVLARPSHKTRIEQPSAARMPRLGRKHSQNSGHLHSAQFRRASPLFASTP